MIDLTIIIVNWNRKVLLKKCLASIFGNNLAVRCLLFIPLLARGRNRKDIASLLFTYLGICKSILAGKKRLAISDPSGRRMGRVTGQY